MNTKSEGINNDLSTISYGITQNKPLINPFTHPPIHFFIQNEPNLNWRVTKDERRETKKMQRNAKKCKRNCKKARSFALIYPPKSDFSSEFTKKTPTFHNLLCKTNPISNSDIRYKKMQNEPNLKTSRIEYQESRIEKNAKRTQFQTNRLSTNLAQRVTGHERRITKKCKTNPI
jgi:hypothetical protein